MAVIIKHLFIAVFLLFPTFLIGHVIYAPNDIPLLDNRFRIDPETDQITFIFNHSKGHQRVVLVRPDGSKLYQQRHPNKVAWVSSKTQNIVTIQEPMAGPWQAVAELDGDNRIKIISDVQLKVNRLPLKLYAREYITTHVSLYYDGKIMVNPAYLDDAKLTISLLGGANKRMALYQDNGKHYDQLPFDGKLTARLYVDLLPGRYLLHIRTKNDVFIRNVNKDAVVFLSPINYEVKPLKVDSDEAKITVSIDAAEIDPKSVTIDGVIEDTSGKVIKQVMMHNIDNTNEEGIFESLHKLPYSLYTFSGKAYATTLQGREIELQLPERIFELFPPAKKPVAALSQAVATEVDVLLENEQLALAAEQEAEASLFSNIGIIIAISISILLLVAGIVFFILKRKKKKQQEGDISDDELNLDELQPMSIDIKEGE